MFIFDNGLVFRWLIHIIICVFFMFILKYPTINDTIAHYLPLGSLWQLGQHGHYFGRPHVAIWIHNLADHDDFVKWKHVPHYLPFVRVMHRSPVNSPHKGQWWGALLFPWICAWTNGRVNNREACHLRRHRAHSDHRNVRKHSIRRYNCYVMQTVI